MIREKYMKPIFRTDLALLILFVLSLFSGIQIHYASHFQSHEVWHNWSIVHTVVNILLLGVAIVHIKQHWVWFKTMSSSLSRKSKVTIALSIIFVLVSVTGIVLLTCANGGKGCCGYSRIGIIHYWLGIVFGVFALLHFIGRWKIFKKGVKRR